MKKIELNQADMSITEDCWILDRWENSDAILQVCAGCSVHYLYLPQVSGKYTRRILCQEGTNISAYGIIVSDRGSHDISLEILGNDVQSSLQILAILRSGDRLDICPVARAEQSYKNIIARVDQTNILIGDGAYIRAVPRLEIATDDISGWHSCKVHRLWGEVLFYLRSRGLSEKSAEALLLNAEILRHLESIQNEILKRELCAWIHQEIISSKNDQ
jgi:Fe-S cluster assembly scaffold protein SufB